ncbi:conserved hypothetical protein [Trichinella spiralis]|uniref:hypothetical protein n=1 Tax=Trichinella spiralis TaxID=6334 RepID=UPI0001EFCE97|nr:conserved hypothetical protein [Trichinella spiralis]
MINRMFPTQRQGTVATLGFLTTSKQASVRISRSHKNLLLRKILCINRSSSVMYRNLKRSTYLQKNAQEHDYSSVTSPVSVRSCFPRSLCVHCFPCVCVIFVCNLLRVMH